MISTTRVINGLEKLIQAERKKLANYGPEAPVEEKHLIRLLVPAVQKLRRQIEFAEAYGPHWLLTYHAKPRRNKAKAARSSATPTRDNFKEPVCDREEN
jgi:hypothetical protein